MICFTSLARASLNFYFEDDRNVPTEDVASYCILIWMVGLAKKQLQTIVAKEGEKHRELGGIK